MTRQVARFLAPLFFLSLVLTLPAVGPREAGAASSFRAADGKLLGPDGKPFFIVGTNYEGPLDRAWKMWEEDKWDPARVEADLARAAASGINSLRVFVHLTLARQVDAGNFSKLDAFIEMAAKHKLALMITLADYGEEDITKLAATAGKIATRYKDKPIVMAYDIKNEPKYATLVLAKYPTPPALQSDGLVAVYGEKLPMSDVPTWRTGDGKALSPARFSDKDVYLTANHYKLYLEMLGDASTWVSARSGSNTAEFVSAPEAAKWKPYFDAMSATLGAWLAPQVAAIKAADPDALITVGYNDPMMARLPANEALTMISMHRYPTTSPKGLAASLGVLDSLVKAFQGRPAAMTEFGWNNHEYDPNDSGVLEAATWLQLAQKGHAGAMKWMLDDLPPVGNEKEDNFGMFTTAGVAKPVVAVTKVLGPYLNQGTKFGTLTIEPEDTGLKYKYQSETALFVGGRNISASSMTMQPNATGQVFAQWNDTFKLLVTTKTALDVDVNGLTGRPIGQNATLERGTAQAAATINGNRVSFTADPGAEYRIKTPINALDTRIQIVWPHGNAPVNQATKVNLSAYLFAPASKQAVCMANETPVRLWRAVNNGVEEPLTLGARKGEKAGAVPFHSWNFNDIDVSPATDPANKIFFRVSVDGVPSYGSVWTHAADARTNFPKPDVPTGIAAGYSGPVDAKIEIVWPQGNLPVNQADKANVGVYIFQRGGLQSVAPEYAPVVRLWKATNTGVFEQVAVGVKSNVKVGEITHPVWNFNDVDVSAAKDPSGKVYFRVSVDGVDSRSNLWSHASDARTIFPDRDVPTSSTGC